jgi:ubiquinone/menaquinone biosynthesis C-methylase UbiE
MEDRLFDSLDLEAGAKVLDCGCGVGHVAIRGAQRGLRVTAIDIVDRHLEKARNNVRAANVSDKVKVDKCDYHDLSRYDDGSFDGLYTIETFVHATHPETALTEFARVLKPGGHAVFYEYDHVAPEMLRPDQQKSLLDINTYSAMPALQRFNKGVLQGMLKDAGFADVRTQDISKNISPMLWLFFLVAYLPYLIIKFLGLESHFVNTMAGAEGYHAMKTGLSRYIVMSARKPPR